MQFLTSLRNGKYFEVFGDSQICTVWRTSMPQPCMWLSGLLQLSICPCICPGFWLPWVMQILLERSAHVWVRLIGKKQLLLWPLHGCLEESCCPAGASRSMATWHPKATALMGRCTLGAALHCRWPHGSALLPCSAPLKVSLMLRGCWRDVTMCLWTWETGGDLVVSELQS